MLFFNIPQFSKAQPGQPVQRQASWEVYVPCKPQRIVPGHFGKAYMTHYPSQRMMLNMAATLWRIRHLQHSFPCQFFVAVRQICVPITSEHDCKEEKPSMLTKRKLKEEGMQTHAKYHIKVKELAAEFRLKRLEEEKHLNEEQQKKEDIRKFEAEMHERVIENINMENKRMQLQRY